MKDNSIELNLLNECEKEPIHIPSAIQSVGFFILIDSNSLEIVFEAGDTPFEASTVGKMFSDVWSSCYKALTTLSKFDTPYKHFRSIYKSKLYDLRFHKSGDYIIIEGMENLTDGLISRDTVGISLNSLFEKYSHDTELYSAVCEFVRKLSGYDRVMLYKFDSEHNGEVIAESTNSDKFGTFLYHRFPASDIPSQARALYIKNPVRFIADVNDKTIKLNLKQTLDMSFSALRAVSPIHIEYLKHMGVGASMSISIIIDSKLWGLIACHAKEPKILEFCLIPSFELIGKLLAREIYQRAENRYYKEYNKTQREVEQFCFSISKLIEKNGVFKAFELNIQELQKIVPSDGVAVYIKGHEPICFGVFKNQTPKELSDKITDDFFQTDCLETSLNYTDGLISGLISIKLQTNPTISIFFGRVEQIKTIVWAGQPAKDFTNGVLSPRESFESWKEIIKGKSIVFDVANIDALKDNIKKFSETVSNSIVMFENHMQEKILIQQSKMAFMGEMINVIAHQWKQPLTALSLFIEELSMINSTFNSDEIEKIVQQSDKLIAQMVTTVNDFRKFLTPNKQKREFLIGTNIDYTISLVKKQFELAGIKIVPIIESKSYLNGFPNELTQVFLNILSNAKDVLLEKNIKNPYININVYEENNFLIINISDNGGGIDEKVIDKIFDSYFTTKSEEKGTGIGLYISKIIIEENFGGTISVKNIKNGACFSIKIPLINNIPIAK